MTVSNAAIPAVSVLKAGRTRVRYGRRWLRAFRRTRPFWGALWLGAGGYWILHFSLAKFQVVVASGFGGISGWLIGGGMMICALLGLLAPSQKLTVGVIGLVLSIVSLVASNLGGFFIGMALGIVGATMILAWGPKRERRRGAASA